MKKYFLFIVGVIILLSNSRGIAQQPVPTLAQIRQLLYNMHADSIDSWWFVGGPVAFYHSNEAYIKDSPKFDIWLKLPSKDYLYYTSGSTLKGSIFFAQLYNATELELATTSITPANATQYQYHVVTNDGLELVPWTTPSLFRSNKFTSYSYLGKFDCRHKSITLTIADKDQKSDKSVYVFNNDDIPPVKINTMDVQYRTGQSAKNASDRNKGFGILLAKDVERINFSIENTSKNELYHVYLKREYTGKDTVFAIGNNWEHNFNSSNPTMFINSSYFNKPGKYTIIIRPEITGDYPKPIIIGTEATAHFTTFAAPLTLSLKTVELIIIILLTTGGFMFMMYRRQQKQKLAREARNKQTALLQLQSVRAQLNPHFIFNSLAGIQNLINKNAIEDANKYLTRFARLTRNVLDEGYKDLVSIEQEISLLDDYLQMEQTRFGFKFNITVSKNTDQQIEIPAMLIQPFAENAVKHGTSSLKDKGIISISIDEMDTDITLTIYDNGKGFDNTGGAGKGIKLCEERIALLNSIYKKSIILLRIETNDSGTTIIIHLKNWL